ncbi:MAG: tRNA dihydrouridine synthase DusB [Candidatus Eisenbacteria bacterium]|nr:tRNA dihydrouridine synthase DusB [Candidatus Eisenbacteria bacterium]
MKASERRSAQGRPNLSQQSSIQGRPSGRPGSNGPTIGSLTLDSRLVLAPLAGIADSTFRLLCKEKGASLVYTEMISADGLVRENAQTLALLSFSEAERYIAIQLFGADPDVMARAAEKAMRFNPDMIDLNFGCPARKIVGKQAGCALLNNLALLRKIAAAVVSAVGVPVTAKIRSGWDDKSMNADRVSEMLEDCGVKAVAVHARSRADKFSGKADWEVIARVKSSVNIPVIGNGDVTAPEDAARMLEETGCDAVMIGRGALGNPWIFSRTRHFLATGELPAPPSEKERLEFLLRHIALAEEKARCAPSRATNQATKITPAVLAKRAAGGYTVNREVADNWSALAMRKHVGWYTRGLPQSCRLRQEANRATSFEETRKLVVAFASSLGVELNEA